MGKAAKRMLAVLLAVSLSLSLAACAQTGRGSGDAGASVSSSGSAPQPAGFPVTVTDQLGRQVTIREEPRSIVSGYYISTSLLIALGLADRLVGIEAKADSRPIYSLSAPALLALPSVGTAKQFDLEVCASLEPDLVVLPAKLKDTIPALEELGLTVLTVNPEDRALLEEAAVLLGAATGTGERAAALLEFGSARLDQMRDALPEAETPAPSVYLAGNSAFLSCAGPEMYQDSLIRAAGGVNAAAELSEDYWAEVSYEQLLAWDPDYIILAADADYTIESVLADPALADLSAVQNGLVFQFPNAIESWDSPVPSAFLGSLWLASVLHPVQVRAEMWQEAAAEFYETFYGFTPDPALTA